MTRTAIVTGAARGIGLENAQDTVDAIEAAGWRATAVTADVNDEATVRQAVDQIANELGAFDAFKEQAAQSNPVGRVGQPEDIAHAAAFFASHEAGFVNGQVLYVAGGPVD